MSDEKISAMPNAGAITGAELVPLVQGGSNVKATLTTLKAFMVAGLTTGAAILFGNGSGGFSNVTIGSGLSFTGGTLSATGGGGGSPGGASGTIQYNNAGSFGGITNSVVSGAQISLGTASINLATLTSDSIDIERNAATLGATTAALVISSDWTGSVGPIELFISPTGTGFSNGRLISATNNLGVTVFEVGSTGLITATSFAGGLSSATGLPISTGVSGLAAGIATFLATPTSANLAAAVTNETGTGSLVFATSPTLAGTVAGSFTLSGNLTASAAGAASSSALIFTGAIETGGSATTNFPHLFIQPTGASAVTSWVTTGTGLGMNLASGFVGNFIDCHVNGAASVFSVSSAGGIVAVGCQLGATNTYSFNGRSKFGSPADGLIILQNNAGTSFSRLNLGGNGGSFPAIKANGNAINIRLADDSADTALTAAAITASGTLTLAGGTLLSTSAALTNNAAAALATITNGPTAGNPTKWIPINDNGTTRNIPAW